MTAMRLWSDEIEAMRPEARDAVTQGFAVLAETLGRGGTPPADPVERAQAQRALYEKNFTAVPEGVEREIAGVRCRVFTPEGTARAVYLHFHGGGMVVGAPEMSDLGNRALARAHDVAVVSVDYRLAPEHPFPAGPDDGVAVAAWLLEHAEAEFGSPRLLTGGESAGGYMAGAVLLRIRDELDAADRVLGANLVFGVFDWGRSPSQRGLRPHAGPDLLDPDGIRFFQDCYLPGLTDDECRDPGISPAYADLRGLPSLLCTVGSTDHLLDDTLLLAARATAAGTDVELFVAPDMPHGFMAFPCGITRAWAATTDAWFTRVLAG
ncbi:MAG: alpha/beta hydrolase fold domain-containing protein [Acidimicrobiia bacterium]|jgi:acetyl esterase/lipase